MSIVRLDITKQNTRVDIESFLIKEKFKRGDTLQILRNKETSEFELLGYLLVIIAIGLALYGTRKGKKNMPVTDSIKDLEKFAEAEAGMKIDIEAKPSASNINHEQLSPRIRRLRGIIKTNENLNIKQILTEELSKKYGI